MHRWFLPVCCALLAAAAVNETLVRARDAQDRASLEAQSAVLEKESASRSGDAAAHFHLALAKSYLSEVSLELGDKGAASKAAVSGIEAARAAVNLAPRNAEYRWMLGTLCGQAIPANILSALTYGSCAKEELEKAIALNPKFAPGYLSRGIGNYYLPESFGGGASRALPDLEKALELDPSSADAHLWMGIALRKLGRNAEARTALEKALRLNPGRAWTKKQLEKTPQT